MSLAAKQSLFISHSAKDKALALLIKKLFKGRLGSRTNPVSIFCSSDTASIEGGKAWFNAIMLALRKSRVCISLLTPHSIYRPWVLFESGGAFVRSENDEDHRMFPVFAHGTTTSTLPGPFTHIRARDLGVTSEVKKLYREISTIFGGTLKKLPNSAIARLSAEAKRGPKHWENVRQALVGDRLDSTPFSADKLLMNAERHFFAAGQNLHHLATSSKFRQQLFSWLRKRAGRRAQLLICDPEDGNAVSAWSVVGHQYQEDLSRSVSKFKKWLELSRTSSLRRRLEIRVTKLVTASIICVDPEGQNGTLVLTPVVFGKPISGERPHFAFTKTENVRVFDHYWETYRNEFARGRSVAKVSKTGRNPNPLVQPTRQKQRAAD